MRDFSRAAALLGAILVLSASVTAQEPFAPLRTESPPVIDGRLDDAVWQRAPYVSDFRTWAPDYGKEMVGETRTYMAYDGSNLYFAFHAMDPEPDKIKASVTNRDNIRRDDWICINLDSFNDQQSLYALYVNPLGIQGDTRYAAGQEDGGFDTVWYSSGQIDETGYTVEISIPLKSIRYADGDTVSMGVIFERHISRQSELGTFPPLDPAEQEWLTQMHPMVYSDLNQHTLLEVLPAVTYTNGRAHQEGMLSTIRDEGEFSLTTKYGLTSDLVFDGTFNPDFSQVEADAGQVDVNLRYPLYFTEKRPFFLEGRESFHFGGTGLSELDPVHSIVYTRTIVDPIAGTKLSGKLGNKNTLASIYAADEVQGVDVAEETDYAHNAILRFKRALSEDSYVGGIYAGRELNDHYNRVLGVDGQLRVSESSLLSYGAIGSQLKPDGASQRQDGYTLGLSYNHSTRNVDYGVAARDISEDFNSEMGFVTRTGLLQFSGTLRPRLYPRTEVIRRIDLALSSIQSMDRFSNLWETSNQISVRAHMWGSLNFRLAYSYSTEIYRDQEFKTGGLQASGGGQFTNELFFTVMYRRSKAIYYSDDPYQGESNRATLTSIFQPSDKLRWDFSLVYSDFYRDSNGEKIYDYPIARTKLTYQLNKYLFFRGILEYNDFWEEITTDLLASFTYIPGTVIHLGYGSLYDKTRWQDGEYVPAEDYLETQRRLFFKMSYLWRM
jgi:hypothetical protein